MRRRIGIFESLLDLAQLECSFVFVIPDAHGEVLVVGHSLRITRFTFSHRLPIPCASSGPKLPCNKWVEKAGKVPASADGSLTAQLPSTAPASRRNRGRCPSGRRSGRRRRRGRLPCSPSRGPGWRRSCSRAAWPPTSHPP